ncbi:3-hydroxyacyl-CoA dehydrogenase NAD-binding domain-containing protein [Stakelama tenebrarum]|uniref:enoyl-CoA hydratase n=1 Tax=Stakelama tenebrarum TaxID=2711215 RepID=A0A6G6Y630_9SPHN|nr:3-hydroxyacyl-CoA dehydrogenase NAD-binding domain-containing protein [Sphingosinithalassobacter tenebrarum]QIG80178.1 fatty-acid oxidation protein subunit alpha [Sphingosinithalassobacter tenebrarum]
MTTAIEYLSPTPLTGVEGSRGIHWIKHEEGDRIWLILDKGDTSTNTLDEPVLRELNDLLDEVEQGDWKSVIFRSAKRGGFAAGADLNQFRGVSTVAEVRAKIDEANAVIDRIAALKQTTVAAVHGACVGGGLELALACDFIVARDDASLGFPEVLVGLHPGLGGTARLTHRINPVEAMKLMLTGRSVRAGKAKKLGIVEAVVPERNMANAIEAALSGKLERSGGGATATAMNLFPARKAIAAQMRGETEKQAPSEHYESPYALISLWEKHGGSMEEMLQAERASFAHLLPTDTTQNLVRVFFLRQRLQQNGKGSSNVRNVHVVGAGTMGAEIGAWCALKGMNVTIQDPSREALGKAVASAHKLFDRKLRDPELLRAKDRFTPDLHGNGVRHADLIIEAAPERPELKEKIYAQIEEKAKPDAVIATNTSSLDLNKLFKGVKRPDRFVGIHFFNPVSKLDLVEVVRHDGSSTEAFETAQRFVGDIGKLPLPVTASPGFLVNRALMPYLGEALVMVDEGVQCERIDKAAEEFGMPMGPIELADQVGLDICLAVAESLARDLDHPMPEIPQWLRDKVERGELGRKTGKGVYDYGSDGKPKKDKLKKPATEEMRKRMILPLLDAVASAIDEGVVEDRDSADAAMIFGTGFAPFLGGPIHYAQSRGFEAVATTMERLEREVGPRYKPSPWWRKAKE